MRITLMIIVLFSLCLSCQTKISDNKLKTEDWQLSESKTEKVRALLNHQNRLLRDIYSNLDSTNRKINLLRLDTIKTLANNIRIESEKSLTILKPRYQKNDTVKILAISIKLLEAVVNLQNTIPKAYEKFESDINGQQTEQNDDLIKKATVVREIGNLHKNMLINHFKD